jgi:hypothetical protein
VIAVVSEDDERDDRPVTSDDERRGRAMRANERNEEVR